MSDQQRPADIETLARMAARLAGRDPDEHLKIALGEIVAFDGLLWRYPDFLSRAEAAYHALTAANLTLVKSRNGRHHASMTRSRRGPLEEGEKRRAGPAL